MSVIVSNTCKMRPSPWQQINGWRYGQRRDPCGDMLCPKFHCSSRVVDSTLVISELIDTELANDEHHKPSRQKGCLRKVLGKTSRLWYFETLELLNQHSHRPRTPHTLRLEQHWNPDNLCHNFCLSLSLSPSSPLPPVHPLPFSSFSPLKLLSNVRLILISYKVT